MKSIDLLEHGGGHFHIRHNGELVALADPRGMHYQIVLLMLKLEHAPGTPGMPEWKRALVFDRWCAAWDLPEFQSAQRLAYLVDHYRPAISSDLHATHHMDLGELWRARRWILLLDLIDRLPAHSWYASAVSMDEDHAKMMAESIAAQKRDKNNEDKSNGPSLTTWTPEVAAITNVLDAVRGVQHAIVAVNSAKGKAPEPPKPAQRPITPLEKAIRRVEYDTRKAAHDALAARVLPHKRKS